MKSLEQKKESSSLKTHEEILDLFQEIDIIENKIKNTELLENEEISPEIINQEFEQTEIIEKFIEDDDIPEFITEIIPKDEKEILKKDKDKTNFLFKFLKKEKTSSKKYFFKFKKPKIGELSGTEAPDIKKQNEYDNLDIKQIKSTFTLRLDDQGNLIGLNIKKPRSEIEKIHLRDLFKKDKSKESTQNEQDVKGIKAIPLKIKKVFIKLKIIKQKEGKSESKESKITGVTGKIKGIFSRKSK